MIAGMDLFERRHALAPQASLRFQLLPRLYGALDGITCGWRATRVSLPVPSRPTTASRWSATPRPCRKMRR
jgi:hypothetical protein